MKGHNPLPSIDENVKGQNDVNTANPNSRLEGEMDNNVDSSSENDNSDNDDTNDNTDFSLDLQAKLHALHVKDAKRNRLYISVPKLTATDIKLLNPKVPIDPYSSLEEVVSTDPEDNLPLSQLLDKEETNRYDMRTRNIKRTRHSTKPLRTNRSSLNYSEQMKSDSDSGSPKRAPRKKISSPVRAIKGPNGSTAQGYYSS